MKADSAFLWAKYTSLLSWWASGQEGLSKQRGMVILDKRWQAWWYTMPKISPSSLGHFRVDILSKWGNWDPEALQASPRVAQVMRVEMSLYRMQLFLLYWLCPRLSHSAESPRTAWHAAVWRFLPRWCSERKDPLRSPTMALHHQLFREHWAHVKGSAALHSADFILCCRSTFTTGPSQASPGWV